jgi:hypothetical protein
MRALQKKGKPSLNKNPAYLHALADSERPRLLGPGNNSSEVCNFTQIANRVQCSIKEVEKKTAHIQSLEEVVG